MSNVSTKKASSVELRKQREIVDYMTKRGMRFVAVPVLNDADFLYLSSLVRVRLDALVKQSEKEEDESE